MDDCMQCVLHLTYIMWLLVAHKIVISILNTSKISRQGVLVFCYWKLFFTIPFPYLLGQCTDILEICPEPGRPLLLERLGNSPWRKFIYWFIDCLDQ